MVMVINHLPCFLTQVKSNPIRATESALISKEILFLVNNKFTTSFTSFKMFSNRYCLGFEHAEAFSKILSPLPISLTAFSPTLLETVLAICSALLVADPSKYLPLTTFYIPTTVSTSIHE